MTLINDLRVLRPLIVALATTWAGCTAGVPANAESIVFPPGANVIDVTKPPYNATPNDDTDDTAAFLMALRQEPPNWLIYVPDGTYIISDTLHWGKRHRRQVLQGQSEAGTIIKLRDNTPKFANPNQGEAMIWTGTAPAQRFRNGLRNLTLDTGRNNPGAIGARFIANNQGGIQNITIRSGDNQLRGQIGLDLGYTDEQGPCLMKNVTVRGFDVGVRTKHGVNSVTFEHLTLEGQRQVGLLNEGQVINLRGLKSTNKVPAVRNVAGTSTLTLLEADLGGGDPAGAAIINEANLFARDIRSDGYKQTIANTGGAGDSPVGAKVQEFNSHAVVSLSDAAAKRSLNLPVPETPEVPWDAVEKWVSVTDFGPPEKLALVVGPATTVNPAVEPDVGPDRGKKGKPVNVENWGPALQRAIDSGATTVYFPHRSGGDESVFGLYGPIHIRGNVRRIIGCETALGRIVDSNRERSRFTDPALIPVFIIEDGSSDTVVIERFDTWYAAPRIEHRAKRTLAIKSMSIYDLETFPGSGDTFLEDVRAKRITVNEGTRLWARQLNTEGVEEPRNLVNGGQMWILGLKTENDTTVAQIQNGGTLEICGAFFYSNKDLVDPSYMFINRGGKLSASFGEFVGGKVTRPFAVLQEWRDATPQVLGKAHGRAGGSMATLLVSEVGPTKSLTSPPPDASPR